MWVLGRPATFASRERGAEAANIQAFSEQTSGLRDSCGASRAGSAAMSGCTAGSMWARSSARPRQAAPLTRPLVPGNGWASPPFVPDPPLMQHPVQRCPAPPCAKPRTRSAVNTFQWGCGAPFPPLVSHPKSTASLLPGLRRALFSSVAAGSWVAVTPASWASWPSVPPNFRPSVLIAFPRAGRYAPAGCANIQQH